MILLTGGAGFIGSHVAKKLLEQGNSLVIVDNFNDYYNVSLKKDRIKEIQKKFNLEVLKVDLSDYKATEKIFKKYKFDKICHLAAQAGVRYSLKNPLAYTSSNIVATVNLFELARKYNVKNFIFGSSSSVYGNNKKIPFSEKDKADFPVSLYGATKKSGEAIAHAYHDLFKINCTVLRFFTVYGPWGRPDMAYFSFTESIIKKRPIKVFNQGKMKRDFTYIDDIVQGTVKAVEKCYPYEVINLGNNKPIELEYFIACIEKAVGKKAIKQYHPFQLGDVSETWTDIKKAKKLLNFKPQISIEQGIGNFVDWYKKYYHASQ